MTPQVPCAKTARAASASRAFCASASRVVMSRTMQCVPGVSGALIRTSTRLPGERLNAVSSSNELLSGGGEQSGWLRNGWQT